MDSLKHTNLRYDLLLNRFQQAGVKNSRQLALARLHAIAQRAPPSAPADTSSTAPSQLSSTLEAFEQECRRVSLIYRAHHQQLWAGVLEAVSHLRAETEGLLIHSQTAQHEPHGIASRLSDLRHRLDVLGKGAVTLDAVTQHDIAGIAGLAMLADGIKLQVESPSTAATRPTPGSLLESEYYKAAETALLGMLRLDSIVLGLSDAYALLQLAESDAHAAALHAAGLDVDDPWVPPQKFSRVTRKFWIRLDDVMRFKMEIIKHLPVLVYGTRRKLTSIDPGELPFLPAPMVSDSSPISSVYLDNLPDLVSYHARLRREDGATAVRLRWYGKRDPEDRSSTIFVERKVHREAVEQVGDGSVKERVGVPQGQIPRLLAGLPVLLPEGSSKEDMEFVNDVQAYIVRNRQVRK